MEDARGPRARLALLAHASRVTNDDQAPVRGVVDRHKEVVLLEDVDILVIVVGEKAGRRYIKAWGFNGNKIQNLTCPLAPAQEVMRACSLGTLVPTLSTVPQICSSSLPPTQSPTPLINSLTLVHVRTLFQLHAAWQKCGDSRPLCGPLSASSDCSGAARSASLS